MEEKINKIINSSDEGSYNYIISKHDPTLDTLTLPIYKN
jgi:hypothetical protein